MRFGARILGAGAAALAMAPAAAPAAVYVVDGGRRGNDANPGTAARPLRTVGRAAALAGPGDRVLIRPGIYREAVTLRRSGTARAPIVFEAAEPWTVVLTGGERPTRWSGREYPLLFGPERRDPANAERWIGADWITVRGLVFRNAPGSAVGAATGWRMEDCVVEWANFDGIVARGDHMAFLRCVVQNCGNNGMAGGFGADIRVRDCLLRRCNQAANSPGGLAGGCKFLFTRRMRVENVISYDQMGTGWWFDWDNTDYVITGGTIFGCHAGKALENGRVIDQPWAADGIWTEGNPGPGRIEKNVLYSNVSGGIGVLDSPNVTVESNTIVDCGAGVSFRDVNRDGDRPEEERVRRIANEVVRGNRFKAWRGGAAISTRIGEWKRGATPPHYGVMIDRNVYDPTPSAPLISWLQITATTLPEVAGRLGSEYHGAVRPLPFRGTLVPTHTTGEDVLRSAGMDRYWQVPSGAAERLSIDSQLRGVRAGSEARVPVFGRTDRQGDTYEVYDLANHRHLRLRVPATRRAAFERDVTRYCILEPIWLRIRLVRKDPYLILADYLGRAAVAGRRSMRH